MQVGHRNGGGGRLGASESRELAADAAAAGDAWACVEAVVRGPLFDGLVRRLCRFEHVDADLAYDLFASALDDLYGEVSAGRQVRDPIAWVRRVALNHACDAEAEQRHAIEYLPERDDRHQRPQEGDGVSRDVLRKEALRLCWGLVDQIQQARPRAVVRLLLEAIEAGRPDGLPAVEIAEQLEMTRAAVHTARTRGLQALVELIEADGHQLSLDFARRLEAAWPSSPADQPIPQTIDQGGGP